MGDERAGSSGFTRRGFLGLSGAALALPVAALGAPVVEPAPGDSRRRMHVVVNGTRREVDVEPRTTLIEVLREELGLTGTKLVCDRAACGACSVLLDGRAVFSCHLLAVQVDGRAVETIEGVARGDRLHPLQRAFMAHDAMQCGYCTPGMIVTLKGALDRNPGASREELRRAIAGNVCRCGAYNHILDAAVAAAGEARASDHG
jgi:aerobic-type carbon monoxide dehydrogenase small subunit (CoxS/CutS family)